MISNLDVTIANRQGRSFLKDAYVTQPFKIVPVGQNNTDRAAYLMIMNSSPGILDGDDHRIDIQVEEGSILQLKSQSYQRLFNMDTYASQHMSVKLAKSSSFSYVPHPIVPHKDSSFRSSNKIELEDNCLLMLGEIITCGRKYSGEQFEYSNFQNLVEVYYNRRLIFKDNVMLQPATMPLSSIGLLEGYTHQGNFIFINTKNYSPNELIEYFHEVSQQLTSVTVSISAIQYGGFVIRILGNSGEQLFDFFQQVQDYIWNEIVLKNQEI